MKNTMRGKVINIRTTRPQNAVKALIEQPEWKTRFNEVLGERAPQFMAALVAMTNTDTALRDCEPVSVISSALTAAALDLSIDSNLGEAHVIPYQTKFGKRARFQIGYKGFIQLALRSGCYAKMNATPVNSEALAGYDEVGDPVIDWSKIDRTRPAIGYAFAWKTTNGFSKVVYWSRSEIEAHASKYSRSYQRSDPTSAWHTSFDAMALKTVIKHGISLWGIKTVKLQTALAADREDMSDNNETEPQVVVEAASESDATGSLNDEIPMDDTDSNPGEQQRIPTAESEEKPATLTQPRKHEQENKENVENVTAPTDELSVQEKLKLALSGVPFGDFVKWLSITNRGQTEAKDWDQVPDNICSSLLADVKSIAKCRKMFSTEDK